MLRTIANAFSVADIRKKLAFTAAMLLLYRLGAFIPAPGIDIDALKDVQGNFSGSGILPFLNMFSGGGLERLSLFALGIMPYITASIIMQILTVVIPRLEQWQQQGAVGQRKITQWTRYVTVAIALLQSTGLAFLFHNGGGGLLGAGQGIDLGIDLFGGDENFNTGRILIVVLTLTAGTALLMWMGELITQRGIGNGMSLLIFASVVSSFPVAGAQINAERGIGVLTPLLVLAVGILVAIVFIELGQRRIPVQFSKRVVGNRMTGGQSTYIPLKVNQSGVIPVIFASSVLYLPLLLTQVLPADRSWAVSIQEWVDSNLVQPDSIVYIFTYGLLIIGFAYFYTAIQFDPAKQADTIRRQGGYIPGIRPGPQTERYLGRILNRITLPGALFVALIALLPSLFLAFADIQNVPFAGISMLIAVGVMLEFMKQIDSQLMMRNYEGFLN